MPTTKPQLLLVLNLVIGCGAGPGPESDADSDMGSDTDTTSDSDTDPMDDGLVRIGQGVGVFLGENYWGEEAMADFSELLANHVDGVEIAVQGNWKYYQWGDEGSVEERASEPSINLADQTRVWLDALHLAGLQGAVSINYKGSLPAVSHEEMGASNVAEYRSYGLDSATGARVEVEGFDWSNPVARDYALQAFTDCSSLIGPSADWLFINEATFNSMSWDEAPLHSDAAMANFKAFVGEDKGLPANLEDLADGVSLVEAELYNTSPSEQDWAEYDAWKLSLYWHMLDLLTRGFAAGQADNPDYRGAIWFMDEGMVDIETSQLETAFSVPGVTHGVVEYVYNPTAGNPTWDAWSAAAAAHEKKLGAFAPLSKRDTTSTSLAFIPNASIEQLDSMLEDAIGIEEVPMIVMYYAGSFDPDPEVSNESYREDAVDIWDDWTHPDGPDANPTDWTISD